MCRAIRLKIRRRFPSPTGTVQQAAAGVHRRRSLDTVDQVERECARECKLFGPVSDYNNYRNGDEYRTAATFSVFLQCDFKHVNNRLRVCVFHVKI